MAEFLFVAHPGHELLVYKRFFRTRLRVMVLTDGSGGAGRSRIGLSRELLDRLSGEAVEPFGRYTDARFYDAILQQDVAFFGALTDRLAEALADPAIDTLISDAAEHYNPVHDLCFVVGALAARRLESQGRRLRHFVCPIVADGEGTSRLDETLGKPVVTEKRRAAQDFADHIADLAHLMEARPQLVDQEILITPRTDGPLLPPPPAPPFYEAYGRERLARRGGGELITYRRHMAPLVAALEAREAHRLAALGAGAALVD